MSHNFKNNDGIVLKIQIGEIREKTSKKGVPTNAFNGRPLLIKAVMFPYFSGVFTVSGKQMSKC